MPPGGFSRILHVCDAKVRRRRLAGILAKECSPEEFRRVEFLSVGEAVVRIGELAAALPVSEATGSEGKTLPAAFEEASDETRKAAMDTAWASIKSGKARDRRKPDAAR